MTLTATVTHDTLRNGTINRYVITLNNGTVAKRQGKRTFSHLCLPIDRSGSTTSASNNLQTLIRECGGREGLIIVETATGRIIDCAALPNHKAERRAAAASLKQAIQAKRCQEFVAKAPKNLKRKFEKSLMLFTGWLAEWEGKDQDRVERLNDLIAWKKRCLEALAGMDESTLIGFFNLGTDSEIALSRMIEDAAGEPK